MSARARVALARVMGALQRCLCRDDAVAEEGLHELLLTAARRRNELALRRDSDAPSLVPLLQVAVRRRDDLLVRRSRAVDEESIACFLEAGARQKQRRVLSQSWAAIRRVRDEDGLAALLRAATSRHGARVRSNLELAAVVVLQRNVRGFVTRLKAWDAVNAVRLIQRRTREMIDGAFASLLAHAAARRLKRSGPLIMARWRARLRDRSSARLLRWRGCMQGDLRVLARALALWSTRAPAWARVLRSWYGEGPGDCGDGLETSFSPPGSSTRRGLLGQLRLAKALSRWQVAATADWRLRYLASMLRVKREERRLRAPFIALRRNLLGRSCRCECMHAVV